MKERSTLLSDLLEALSEEELIRVAYRLRKKGLEISVLAIDLEIGLRKLAKIRDL